ncbi:MAG TPA: hypothetical protein VJ302_05555, partial [Blastocatellia bacterium]|nr:hypothetical protein [Blastocatellia bacterium]
QKTIGRAPKELAREREEWARRNIADHKRHATTLGHLSYAWSVWIEAAKVAGALNEEEAGDLWGRVWLALSQAGSKQDAHRNAQNPVTRFLELLQSAFASQRAHLESITGGPPTPAHMFGWRKQGEDRLSKTTGEPYEAPLMPCGDRIGWHTGEEIYLLPDATFAMLERFSASGEGIGVQQTTLWKHLYEAGVLIDRDEQRRTYPVRRSVAGSRVRVLVLRTEIILCTENAAHAAQESNKFE